MADRERDVVVVDGDRRSSYGWLIGLIVVAILVILFFALGGMNLFNGAQTDTINVDVPDKVQVETTNP